MKFAVFLKSSLFLFINSTLWLNNLKTRTVTNAKISVFVNCAEAIMYLLLYNFMTAPLSVPGYSIKTSKLLDL